MGEDDYLGLCKQPPWPGCRREGRKRERRMCVNMCARERERVGGGGEQGILRGKGLHESYGTGMCIMCLSCLYIILR